MIAYEVDAVAHRDSDAIDGVARGCARQAQRQAKSALRGFHADSGGQRA
jgi:hypothetical protein